MYTMMFESHVTIVLHLSNVSVYTIMLSPYLPGAPNRGGGWEGGGSCSPLRFFEVGGG